MKVIENKILPPKGFVAINLFTIILTRDKRELTKELLLHERIHSRQMLEMLFLFVYLWYVVEFAFRLIQYRNWQKAYRNISFEREAYKNQNNSSYLKERKLFAWVKYL
ncbi:MAG: hypothetical protein KBT03_02415 [Bacteroidales bacterium]|nr:hypothetical protein [Candidatus Scybalousia scybalohippi]